MAGMSNLSRLSDVSRWACMAAAVLAATSLGTPALAAIPSPTGFRVDIASSPRVLEALDAKRDGEIDSQEY
jgi:hypothetical protein